MKRHFIYLHLFFYCLIIFSCARIKKQSITIKDEVEAIKFMGTITTQSRSIDEKAFWYFRDEHAILIIRNNNFIEDVRALKNHNQNDFDEYKYCFVVKKNGLTDTLYSDKKLKTWILKENKKEVYFYDKDGIIAEDLKNTYSFFNECW